MAGTAALDMAGVLVTRDGPCFSVAHSLVRKTGSGYLQVVSCYARLHHTVCLERRGQWLPLQEDFNGGTVLKARESRLGERRRGE